MTTITCLKELEELKEWDNVKFIIEKQIIEYQVWHSYLMNKKIRDTDIPIINDEIFKVLEIDKHKIADKMYKYKTTSEGFTGLWPCSRNRDFPALTRLVKELYLIIEGRKTSVFTKFTRFEIMDI